MRVRHHNGTAHQLEHGKLIVEGCVQCEDERLAGSRPLITDESPHFRMGDWYVVWERADGFVGATTYHPRDEGPWKFKVLLQTADWVIAHAVIRAYRTAAVMNQDLWPISKSAQSNYLGVML